MPGSGAVASTASSPGAAVDFARERGARALEAYPMITEPGVEITWGETHVGTRSIFEAAGLTEIAAPDAAAGRDADRLPASHATTPAAKE